MNLCEANQFYDMNADQCANKKSNGGACTTNDECDLTLGLSCQSGKCSCQSGQYFVNRCTSCWAGTFSAGKCFQVSSDQLTYDAANAKCQTFTNGRLAMGNSEDKYNYLVSLYSTAGSNFFVGARALVGQRFRYSDGSNDVIRWIAGNPDNYGGTYFASENCLEQTGSGYNDVTCTASKKYVCETDVCPTTQYYDGANSGCLNKKSNGATCAGSDECDTSKGLTCQGSTTKTCSCQAGLVWGGSSCDCPTPWIKNGDSCYLKFDTPKTFADAQLDCISKNALLINVNTEAKYLIAYNYRNGGQNLFIGAYAKAPLQFYNFDGSSVLSHWYTGEPNNAGQPTSSTINEGCVEISEGGFNDLPCTLTRGYTCEIRIL